MSVRISTHWMSTVSALVSQQFDLVFLFTSAFISSSLLPGGSEVVLGYLANESLYSNWTLLSVATLGNTLGGLSSWLIGWLIAWKFPLRALEKRQHQVAAAKIQRWGSPILLLSWFPVIGDPLCLVAGWLRLNFLACLLFIAIGKAARYAVILVFINP